MDLSPYVADMWQEFAVAADAEGAETRAAADRLALPLEGAVRLTLLAALSDAAAEITRELDSGSVGMRLKGMRPEFVCARPLGSTVPTGRHDSASASSPEPAPSEPHPYVPRPIGDDAGIARINLRLPAPLKLRVEEAAGREWLSLNAWLVRAIDTALATGDSAPTRGCGGSERPDGPFRPAMP